uniref:Transposase n=1 Tax=Strongyloides papillosus TaxID=174720 RepID=A0A0N5BGI9_STREA
MREQNEEWTTPESKVSKTFAVPFFGFLFADVMKRKTKTWGIYLRKGLRYCLNISGDRYLERGIDTYLDIKDQRKLH